MEGKISSKIFCRVLQFLSKVPNIKKIPNEHFHLCEAEISLYEIIKFRWNYKILKKIINLQLIIALQENFKRALLNCAPSSIHLHQAYLNFRPAFWTPSTLLEPKYWKIQNCPFWQKIGTVGILVVLIPNLDLKFWNSDPKMQSLGKFGPQNSKLSVLPKHWQTWYGIHIPILVFWICNPKSIFGQIWAKKVKVVWFTWKLALMVSRGCWFLFRH